MVDLASLDKGSDSKFSSLSNEMGEKITCYPHSYPNQKILDQLIKSKKCEKISKPSVGEL